MFNDDDHYSSQSSLCAETDEESRNFDPEPDDSDLDDQPSNLSFPVSARAALSTSAPSAPSIPLDPSLLDHVELDTRDPERRQHPVDLPDHDKTKAAAAHQAAVPSLFVRRSINLLIGSPGAGKSSLIYSQLASYLTAPDHSFLDYPLPPGRVPEQCGAIINTRTMDSALEHIRNTGISILDDPTVYPMRDWEPTTVETLLEAMYRHHNMLSRSARCPVRFLVIEGMQLMLDGVGAINNPRAVKDFYRQMNQFCLERDCTILATVGQAKMRKGEYYPNLADRAYGSVVWAQEASTLIGIERIHLNKPEERRPTRRRIVIQPKRDRSRRQKTATADGDLNESSDMTDRVRSMDFDEQGWLLVVDPAIVDHTPPSFAKLDRRLEEANPGDSWTVSDLQAWGAQVKVSKRTVERWVSSRAHTDIGMLERFSNNLDGYGYRKPLDYPIN